jgi:hypothetical protein
VQADLDGLLVKADDPAALAAAMERLAAQPELAVELAHNAAVPRSLDELCDELIERYQSLIAKRAGATPDSLPASVRSFAGRILALEQQTVDQLAARALGGLEQLAHSLGVDAPADTPLATELMAIERLRDARREIRWRVARGDEQDRLAAQSQQTASEDRAHLEELRAVHAELALVLQAIHAELVSALADGTLARAALACAELELERRTAQVLALEQAQAAARIALEAETSAHARTRAAHDKAARALEAVSGELAQAGAALHSAAEARAKAQLEHQQLARANAQLSQNLRAAELRHAAGLAREEALASELSALIAQQTALAAHSAWLEREAAAVARRTGPAPQALQNVEHFRAAHAALDQLDAELRWRREEMAALRGDGGRVLRALVARSAIGRRLREWGTGA